jgi:hypothetical protein
VSEWYTLKEMIELVDIPENSLKRYIQEHDNFIKFNKEHNRYKIHESAVNVLKKIRKLYGEGHKKDEVNDRLREMGTPMDIVVKPDDDDGIDYKKEFFSMQEMFIKQMQFNEHVSNEIIEMKKIVNKKNADEIGDLRKSLEKKREKENQEALIEATAELVKGAIATNKEELINEVKDATTKLVNIAGEKNEEELKKIVIDTLKEQQEAQEMLVMPETPKKKSIFSWFSK